MKISYTFIRYLDEKCAALDTLIAKKTALLTELETYLGLCGHF